MNYLEKEKLLQQIKGDSREFTNWLLTKEKKPIHYATTAVNKLYNTAGAFDSQRCSYLGLEGSSPETALYVQFRKEKEFKQMMEAPPKPKEVENLNQELFQATNSASLVAQLQALKEEIRQLKGL